MKKTLFFLTALTTALLLSCSEKKEDIIYENSFYRLVLNGTTGSIKAIEDEGINMVHTPDCEGALFKVRLRDSSRNGEIHEYDALQARKCKVKRGEESITMTYSGFPGTDIGVMVTIGLSNTSPRMLWNMSIENNTGYTIDHIDFPNIVVPNDLVATGGTGRIFWPAQEGCLVEDIRIREESPWLKYKPIEYPGLGWGGFYPSSTQMQYMAYYNDHGGIYLAAHDVQCNPKGIEFHRVSDNGIRLDFRHFTGGAGQGTYTMPYDMVVELFRGDWYDASDIYREWRELSGMPVPPKIRENKLLPDWYTESPVIVTYPVRGHRDMGDMTPNELFPYTNALKYIDRYNKLFDSRILALLMHWEGSAPWAPPYVWPPYGGEKNYLEFVDRLHEKGNLAGLYASGIGYTLRSNTDTTYSMYEEYREKNLETVMKVAPDGSLATNGVCAGPKAQRIGYDMCPANRFVKDVVVDQVTKIVASKTDYIQYFDQNLGGSCYPCWGTSHGHSYGPGIWQNTAMQKIFNGFIPVLQNASHKPIVGCEAAAAEPFLPWLLFNDARATINLFAGRPVPAYAFVNHEYVNNFMGNQNAVSVAIDLKESPLNYLQRLSYAFCAGDMLTVILRGNGDMIWDWGTAWENNVPEQKQIITLIRNLNGWRNGAGKQYLVYGRMLKPLPFEGAVNIPMITKPGKRNIDFPSVFTSNWIADNGPRSQFFVNYLDSEQVIRLDISIFNDVRVFRDPGDTKGELVAGDVAEIRIAPLSAVMVNYVH